MSSRRKQILAPKYLYATIILVLGVAVAGLFGARPTYTVEEVYLREVRKGSMDCSVGSALAKKELAKGNIVFLIRIGIDFDSTRMPYTFYATLRQKYGVRLIKVPTSIYLPAVDCHNEKMRQALEQKYGRKHLIQLYETMHVAQYGPRLAPL